MMDQTRHVLGVSGGKDSAALAVYLRDRVPEMEYYFSDTGKELPETYEYLQRLEIVLGKPIARLNSERDFDHWLWVNGGMLPSANIRWCTPSLKIKPFERWVGDDAALSYIAIRADENRSGYISSKDNIQPVYPFVEDGVDKAGVLRILADAGIGLPDYYRWRTRSGCYFCFFQRKSEWVRLADEHPDLFQKAIDYEDKVNYESTASAVQFTWSQGESLRQLIERRNEILDEHSERVAAAARPSRSLSLLDAMEEALDAEDDTLPCLACHL